MDDSRLLSLFLAITLYYLGHFLDLTNFFQIWSMPAGYEKLAVGFEPVRSGEMFYVYDNQSSERLRGPGPGCIKPALKCSLK